MKQHLPLIVRVTLVMSAITAILTAAAPAAVSAKVAPATVASSGCNNYVCIEAEPYVAATYRVHVMFRSAGCPQTAYFHLWGPGFNFDTPVQQYCSYNWTPWYGRFGPGTYCVEGFWWVYPGRYESVGLPCITV